MKENVYAIPLNDTSSNSFLEYAGLAWCVPVSILRWLNRTSNQSLSVGWTRSEAVRELRERGFSEEDAEMILNVLLNSPVVVHFNDVDLENLDFLDYERRREWRILRFLGGRM